jgi:putative SOS response-associated peptidase YedK
MCGRFTQAAPGEVIAALFELPQTPDLAPRYNIAPTQEVAAVRSAAGGGRELVRLHWGLIPSWAKDRSMGSRMINARSETAAEKPAFRAALKARRCLIVADGFYEWQRLGTRKQPFFLALRDGRPFGFAGLWERWAEGSAEPVESCTILTTSANDAIAPIHDRMPVILNAADHAAWLDPGIREPAALLPLLRPLPADAVRAYPVSLLVNNPANDVPGCREPIAGG